MNENESREERKKQESRMEPSNHRGLGKIYYWIIGILFLILLVLIFFIFSRSGNNIDVETDQDQSSMVEDTANGEDTESDTESAETEDPETEDEPADDSTEENEENTESDNEDTEEDTEEDETLEEDLQAGESETVNEDAPHNSDYTVNYNEGSPDRVEIKNQIMAATGLGNDLTEWWVGENGPGRVEATVANSSQSKIYRVYLQYGDGSWHVTSYERLSSNPYN